MKGLRKLLRVNTPKAIVCRCEVDLVQVLEEALASAEIGRADQTDYCQYGAMALAAARSWQSLLGKQTS